MRLLTFDTHSLPPLACALSFQYSQVTTMLDESIPLTAIEWEEWGNPEEKEYYEYMTSYAPVDNVK